MNEIYFRDLNRNDDQNVIIELWVQGLISSQNDTAKTIVYINKALKTDMSNIYKNYKYFKLALDINNNIVGFGGIYYCKINKYFILSRLFVINEFRGCNIAYELCIILIKDCKEKSNVNYIIASVDKKNIASIKLLTKLGFCQTSNGKNIIYFKLDL